MPIEVRELVIRATVDPNSTGSGSGSCGAGSGGGAGKSGGAGSGASAASGADGGLVQACVREVMRILEEKRER
jgi:hypothetical protein